ncbi:19446_t:CDS:2, partial [Dentiscutata erythropus]
MSEEIENNTINFLWNNNRSISSIDFDHELYVATITLVDNTVRVVNLDKHSGMGSNVNKISEVSDHNDNNNNNNKHLADDSLSPVAAATTNNNDDNPLADNPLPLASSVATATTDNNDDNPLASSPLADNSLPLVSPVAATTTDHNDDNNESNNNHNNLLIK